MTTIILAHDKVCRMKDTQTSGSYLNSYCGFEKMALGIVPYVRYLWFVTERKER